MKEVTIANERMSVVYSTFPSPFGGVVAGDTEVEKWLDGIENEFLGEIKLYTGK